MRALVVLVLALTGCVAPALDAPPVASQTTTLPWGITDCAYVIAAVPVDADRLAAKLPEGFRLAPGRLAMLPAGPRATLEFDAYQCASGVGLNGALAPFAYGSHYAAVEPPDALREEGYDAHFVKWDTLVVDETLRDALAAGGLPVHAGDARVRIDGASVTASLSLAGAGGFTLTGVAGEAEAQGEPLPFMEFTPLATAGLARWHARLHNATFAAGTGFVEIATPWARDLVGSDRAPATFIAGRWNVDEADVTFPTAWP